METPATDLLVSLNHVSCGYDRSPVLEDVCLALEPGAFVGVVGPSGAGKTTLLRAIVGAVPRVQGDVRVLGRPVSGKAPRGVGYVPQVETVDWDFPVTVGEVVRMGLAMSGRWLPWASAGERRQIGEMLDRLGVGHLADRHIRDLSGGQQQRVFLARALVGRPKLLLLDEPTGGVDIKTRDDVLHLLLELNKDGIAIVLTTHDLNGVAAHLPQVVAVNRTVVAQGAPQDVFTRETLRRVYGADLTVIVQDDMVVVADAPHTFRAALAGAHAARG